METGVVHKLLCQDMMGYTQVPIPCSLLQPKQWQWCNQGVRDGTPQPLEDPLPWGFFFLESQCKQCFHWMISCRSSTWLGKRNSSTEKSHQRKLSKCRSPLGQYSFLIGFTFESKENGDGQFLWRTYSSTRVGTIAQDSGYIFLRSTVTILYSMTRTDMDMSLFTKNASIFTEIFSDILRQVSH